MELLCVVFKCGVFERLVRYVGEVLGIFEVLFGVDYLLLCFVCMVCVEVFVL